MKGVSFAVSKNEVRIFADAESEGIEALAERQRRIVDDRKEYKSEVRSRKPEQHKMRKAKCTLENCAAELGKPCCTLQHMT